MNLKKNLTSLIVASSLLITPSVIKAATQQDVDYLVSETRKKEYVREYPNEGFGIKALVDTEQVGNLEKQLFFSIYVPLENEKNTPITRVFVTIDYITRDGNQFDLKQLVIGDGQYSLPDGKPDDASEERVFEEEVTFTYKDDQGKDVTKSLNRIEDMFQKHYDLNNPSEKEKIDQIFDYAIEIFKIKTKKEFTEEDKTKYENLKQDIEKLLFESEFFQKSKEDLETERKNRLKSF